MNRWAMLPGAPAAVGSTTLSVSEILAAYRLPAQALGVRRPRLASAAVATGAWPMPTWTF